ncbi:hypothetical protein BDR26DRAFT_103783 [Obelidium mucronatum]|nr:hypothetical protein BDR26DRAFT_103783 [Obelidium mucronatum]
MKQVTVLWLAAMSIPVLRIGPRVIQLFYQSDRLNIRNLLYTKKSPSKHSLATGQASPKLHTTSQFSSRSLRRLSRSISQRSRSCFSSINPYQQDPQTVVRVHGLISGWTYRLKYQLWNLCYWSDWIQVYGGVTCELNKKFWIELVSLNEIHCAFSLDVNASSTIFGKLVTIVFASQVKMNQSWLFRVSSMEAEFASEPEALEFYRAISCPKDGVVD